MADELVAGDSYVSNNSIHHTMQVLISCFYYTISIFSSSEMCHLSWILWVLGGGLCTTGTETKVAPKYSVLLNPIF